jgi:hypothetical protein
MRQFIALLSLCSVFTILLLFSYWSSFPNSCNAPRESSGYERRTVATMVVSLELTGRLITQRCVQIMLISSQ